MSESVKEVIEENKEDNTVRVYSYCQKCGCTHIDPATHPFTCEAKDV